MTGVIKWIDPPLQRGGHAAVARGADDWSHVAEELRGRPHQWGVIAEFAESGKAQGLSFAIMHGRYVSFIPTCDFEAVSRKQDGVSRVYARYVGQPS
jgi:hypothetical protein